MKQNKGLHLEEWYESGPMPRSIGYPRTVPRKRTRICDVNDCWKVRKLRETRVMNDPRVQFYSQKLGLERVLTTFPQAVTRLQLVLDLENTLVETVREDLDLAPLVRSAIEKISFRVPGMLVVRRPSLDAFLGLLSKYYDLWLHAAGSALYVTSVLKVIDPACNYFGNRVFTSEAALRNQPKKLTNLPGFTAHRDLTLILDDQPELWNEACILTSKSFSPSGQVPSHSEVNLSTLSRKFSFTGVRVGEMSADCSDLQLEYLLAALIQTFHRFVENREANTASFELSEVRKQVLEREVLCFEGYKQKKDSESGYTNERYRLYHFAAAALGACEQLDGCKVEEKAQGDWVSGPVLFQCLLHCNKLQPRP